MQSSSQPGNTISGNARHPRPCYHREQRQRRTRWNFWYECCSKSVVGKHVIADEECAGVPQENKIDECRSALFLTDPADDREQLISFKGRLVASACSWVIKNSMYANWLDGSNQSQLLWLCGASGTGKTMLSIFLTEWLQKNLQGKTSAVLLYYFCDSRDERRNHAVYILRGMIYQLLQKRPELFKLLLPDYLVQKANLFKQHSLEPLWRIFESMTRDPATGPVYCVIDGLDECHSGSLEHFLKKVSRCSIQLRRMDLQQILWTSGRLRL